MTIKHMSVYLTPWDQIQPLRKCGSEGSGWRADFPSRDWPERGAAEHQGVGRESQRAGHKLVRTLAVMFIRFHVLFA